MLCLILGGNNTTVMENRSILVFKELLLRKKIYSIILMYFHIVSFYVHMALKIIRGPALNFLNASIDLLSEMGSKLTTIPSELEKGLVLE